MSKLFACISHKGGTGRSVTTANIAFHLSMQGENVCLVDLDLASPTLGAVVGLTDIAAGAPDGRGIHDILDEELKDAVEPENVATLLRNVWESSDIAASHSFRSGALQLLPGTADGSDMFLSHEKPQQRDRLARALFLLRARYDFVFCDLRSGTGTIADAFICQPIAELVDGWIFFHRWTRQHLAGVVDLTQSLAKNIEVPTRFMTVRTAAVDPSSVPKESRTWVNQRNDELRAEYEKFTGTADSELTELGTIPSEMLLQWRECILTEEMVSTAATRDTVDSFRNVASKLLELEK